LRSPLSIINGYAYLMEDQINEIGMASSLTANLLDSLQQIQHGALRMAKIIEDLTELARIDGGQVQLKREPVAIASFLPDFLQRAAMVLDASRIQLEIASEVSPVLADPDRLERILTNLLSNALKFSTPDTPVQVCVCQQDGELRMSITDQGRGIPPNDIPLLFRRFYRIKDEHRAKGIGLGLYITKKLVEAHGGCIWVESEVEQGSTFFFTLPVVRERT